MKKSSWIGRWEPYALAIAPLLGISIAFCKEVGRFLYLGVPFDLIELDTPKILVSTIGVLVVTSAYLAMWLDGVTKREGNAWTEFIAQHVTMNAILSFAMIYRTEAAFLYQVLPVLLLSVWLTVMTLSARFIVLRAKASGSLLNIGYSPMLLSMLSIAMFATISGLVCYLGYSGERNVGSRLVVAKTHVAFVGMFSGQYVLKPFDPDTQRVLPGAISLQAPNGQLNLVEVPIRLLPATSE